MLERGKEFREYVVNYTNAATILRDDFKDTEDLDGLFSGWDPEKKKYTRGSREARIYMDDFRSTLPCLDHPLEADRMVFRHGRSHDQNGIRIRQILLRSGRAAAPERSA